LVITLKKNNFHSILLNIFIAIFILILYLSTLEIIYQKKDFSVIVYFLRSYLTIISSYITALYLYKKYKYVAHVVFGKIVFICSIIQGLVIWLSFLSVNFRDYMSLFFYRDYNSDNQHLILLRVPGFVDSGGDGSSMNQGFLCVVGFISMYIITEKKYRTILSFLSIISAIACLFVGRSGLYISFFFLLSTLAIYQNEKFNLIKLYKFIFYLLTILFIFFITANFLGNYGNDLKDEYGYEYPIVRFLSGFMLYADGDSYQDSTIKTLTSDMIILPNTFLKLIFGNNSFGNGSDSINSDVGYIRYIFGMGIIGSLYFISCFFILYYLIRNWVSKINFDLSGFKHNSLLSLIFIIFLYGMIAHYKIYFLTTRVYVYVLFSYFFIIYFNHLENKKDNLNAWSE
jgi:hypothetical protein